MIGSDPMAAALAGRGLRLAAVMIDSLVAFLVLLLGVVSMNISDNRELFIAVHLMFLFGMVFLSWYQIRLLSGSGETIGKQAMGIRIVRHSDGGNPGFVRAVALRSLVPNLMKLIPYFGSYFVLADVLLIFGQERRCIHDLIAGTRVIVS